MEVFEIKEKVEQRQGLREARTANEQFCKSWVEVQNSTVVLLFSGSTKLNFSTSIYQPLQSCQNVSSNPIDDCACIGRQAKH